ncbi:hypothetical protein [Pseudoflavonifractor phocaeensis]|uniref:hypothetical protein n=1 Tax=Pseudoflavonifractor phocaeensis TaxID=1870988 RepID=UPI00195B8550|nr:hypothetical protein [Pseudoflavonifractor phocaeensis]MBM6887627.1 hypothetical protein [Pseudoflavonifractor phocaeensis]
MKPEKILEIITRAADALPEDDRALFQFMKKAPYLHAPAWTTGAMLGELSNILEREISTNAAKKSGRLTQRRALERIYKATVAKNADCRPAMAGTFEQDNARCLCDGYRAIRIKSQDVEMPASAMTGDPMDLSSVFDGMVSRPPVSLPSAEWLKAEIKIAAANARAQGIKPSRFGAIAKIQAAQGPVYINAQYLLDMLEAIPDYNTATTGNAYAPVYIAGADGDALVLPIRFNADKNDNAKNPVIDCSREAEGRATA